LFSAVNHVGKNKVASHTMQKIVGSQKENLLAWINMKKKKLKYLIVEATRIFFKQKKTIRKHCGRQLYAEHCKVY